MMTAHRGNLFMVAPNFCSGGQVSTPLVTAINSIGNLLIFRSQKGVMIIELLADKNASTQLG
jgi:hypothetical protein